MAKNKSGRGFSRFPSLVKVTWAHATRDMMMRSIDKGQGPLFLLGIIILAIILRMPPDEVAEVSKILMKGLANWSIVGYILFAMTLSGWVWHAKHQRRITFKEQDRMGEEKAKLQRDRIGESMKSSRE